MTTDKNMTELGDFCNHLVESSGDVLRQLIEFSINKVMEADVDNRCGASRGTRVESRVNSRNGHRQRPWDTRAGTIQVQVPKLRRGTYFPAFLEPRRRTEKALYQVISECYLLGVSTRRVDALVKAMGIDGIDKSQVSVMSQQLDEKVAEFRQRPLDADSYKYVWVDALYIKVREGGRVVGVATAVATAVNTEGIREIIGLETFTQEDNESWTCFLRNLVNRGLKNVDVVVSDAHIGLKRAISSVLPGSSWQRCRTHAMKNLLSYVPKHTQEMVATLVRSVFAQPDATAVRGQFKRVVSQLNASKMAKSAEFLESCEEDLLAFTAFPKRHWRQIWSNNPQERLNREIRRRTDVVGIFPHREALVRLVGAVLAEQHDEWQVSRRYMVIDEAVEVVTEPLDALALTSHKEH